MAVVHAAHDYKLASEGRKWAQLLSGPAFPNWNDWDYAATQALEAGGLRGRHLALANRSGARLALGNATGAVDDAVAAAEAGPPSFTTALIRQARLQELADSSSWKLPLLPLQSS